MAISWHWAFGPESSALMQSDMGWAFSGPNAPSSAPADVYSYAGSPTRYAMIMTNNTANMTLPAVAGKSPKGWVAVPFKASSGSVNPNRRIILLNGAFNRQVFIQTGGDGKSLNLFVDGVFKASTIPYDWNDWRYVALKYDMSTTTFSGQIFVDGVAATPLSTDPSPNAETSISVSMQSAITTESWKIGQVICYDNPADAGEVPRFVTRVEPNADGADVGTWTPTGAPTDWQALKSPLNTTTYSENTNPAPGDRVEVLSSGGGSDLDTALGTTTTAIDSVCVHAFSTGQALTARALVGDGTGEAAGDNVIVNPSNTSYGTAIANTRPGLGGAWTGADAPTMVYEIVST